jgi:predicted HTH domain antitoxin
MKRTNIMLTEEQHKKMKAYAKKERRTLGHMVRDALDTVYREKNSMEQRRQVALNAYQEGLISLGKLSEVLGVDPLSARLYLKEQHIPLQVQDLKDISRDAADA